MAGAVNVTVPNVENRDDYVVVRTYPSSPPVLREEVLTRKFCWVTFCVVFGDSGNTSGKFTITGTTQSA